MTEPEIEIARQGALATITLRRPSAGNALTNRIRAEITAAIPKLARDPQVYALAIRSAVPRVFCSGGDMRELLALVGSDPAAARGGLAGAYMLNWLLECFSKPTVSLIDGPVTGTGVGISIYGTHRVAGEHYAFAVPQTRLGLFPDGGVAHVLARLPDDIGMYLGLTGRSIDRADALRLGLATHCVPAAQHEAICSALAEAEPIDPLLDGLHEDPGPAGIDTWREVIARCFSARDVSGIRQRLAAETGSAGQWASAVLADIDKGAPLSLAVTHRHIREAAGRDLRQTLTLDYRLAGGMIEGYDLAEAVRAAMTDMGDVPGWRPAVLTDVTPGMIERLFHPGPSGDELALPTRQEMQASRV